MPAPSRDVVPVLLSIRHALMICSAALGISLCADSASAQQGYEFGIRFQPVNFRPLNFNGFSFRQTSFRPQNTQPIQFERITFPALNSRAVRRSLTPTRQNTLDSRRGPIRVSRRRDDFGERTRLAYDLPDYSRRRGNPPQSTRVSQGAYFPRTPTIALRSRRDVVRLATQPTRRVSDRREVLARRLADARELRVR